MPSTDIASEATEINQETAFLALLIDAKINECEASLTGKEEFPRKWRHGMKVAHVGLLISNLLLMSIACLLYWYGIPHSPEPWNARTIGIDIGVIISVIFLISRGANYVRNTRKEGKWPKNPWDFAVWYSKRPFYFGYPAILALVLELIGSFWLIWTLIFIVAELGFLLTYPNEKRVDKWLHEANCAFSGSDGTQETGK